MKNKQDLARTDVLHVEPCSVGQSKLSQRALRIVTSVSYAFQNDFRIFESIYHNMKCIKREIERESGREKEERKREGERVKERQGKEEREKHFYIRKRRYIGWPMYKVLEINNSKNIYRIKKLYCYRIKKSFMYSKESFYNYVNLSRPNVRHFDV